MKLCEFMNSSQSRFSPKAFPFEKLVLGRLYVEIFNN